MTCPDHESLSAFVDSELDATALAKIERHLSSCASCWEFVIEMRGVEARGRSAFQAISVTDRPQTFAAIRMASSRRPMRRLALAAAVVLLLIAAGLAVAYIRRAPRQLPAPVAVALNRPTAGWSENTGTIMPTAESAFGALSGATRIIRAADVAFERWAAPYRRLRIPLVPMQEVANYRPSEILPLLPVEKGPENRS